MKIPDRNNKPPNNGGDRGQIHSDLKTSPRRVDPDEAEWSPPTVQKWLSDGQPFYAKASFMKLCLPAVFYSLLLSASQKVLGLIPFTSRLRISVEELQSEHCFVPTSNSIAIVTGSNTGVGFETASGLAERGYQVILACRSREKGEAAAKRINNELGTQGGSSGRPSSRNYVSGGKASFLHPLDLSSFSSVRSFCQVFSQKHNSLNILVNNAGINSQGDVTEDGIELCFQANSVGHFLLTKLLMNHLLKAKNKYQTGSSNCKEEAGRIVNLSSVTHHFAPANERKLANHDESLKDLPLNNGIHDQHFWRGCAIPGVSSATYRESKLASILLSMELNKRYGSWGIRSIAVNPGSVSSDIWRHESTLMQKAYKMIYLTPQQGSSTSLAGAIGCFPDNTLHLQPYWQPEWMKRCGKQQRQQVPSDSTNSILFCRKYGVPFPMTEMLGPYIGYAITEPRVPVDGCNGYKSSEALWNVLEEITSPIE